MLRLSAVLGVGQVTSLYSPKNAFNDFLTLLNTERSVLRKLYMQAHQDSNPGLRFWRPFFCRLNYGPTTHACARHRCNCCELTNIGRAVRLLFQLGLLVHGMLFAYRAVLFVRELFLELLVFVCRVVLIFADIAPKRNNDPGFLLCHMRRKSEISRIKIGRLNYMRFAGEGQMYKVKSVLQKEKKGCRDAFTAGSVPARRSGFR